MWSDSNSRNRIWVIETSGCNWKSFIQICIRGRLYYKYLGKLQQPKSNIIQLKQPHSNLGRVKNILKLGTCCGNAPFQLTLIFVYLKLLMRKVYN